MCGFVIGAIRGARGLARLPNIIITNYKVLVICVFEPPKNKTLIAPIDIVEEKSCSFTQYFCTCLSVCVLVLVVVEIK